MGDAAEGGRPASSVIMALRLHGWRIDTSNMSTLKTVVYHLRRISLRGRPRNTDAVAGTCASSDLSMLTGGIRVERRSLVITARLENRQVKPKQDRGRAPCSLKSGCT